VAPEARPEQNIESSDLHRGDLAAVATPANNPPPLHGASTQVELRHFLQQLETTRRLAGKNKVVVVRRDHHQPLAFGEIEREGFAVLFVTIVKTISAP
jgi:hypothetical protein